MPTFSLVWVVVVVVVVVVEFVFCTNPACRVETKRS
jgi:hypothetical protein